MFKRLDQNKNLPTGVDRVLPTFKKSTTTTSVKVTTKEPHIKPVLEPTTSSIFSSSHLATLTTEPMEETFTTACTSLVPAWGKGIYTKVDIIKWQYIKLNKLLTLP